MATNIPLGVPVCLKSHMGNNLQNEFFWETGRCNNQNTEAWEQVLIYKLNDGKFIIQSRWNNKNLQVQPSGRCAFVNHNQELWEKFDIETDGNGKVYFRSCHTGKYMQCCSERFAYCANNERGGWEAWSIVSPNSNEIFTHNDLCTTSIVVASIVAPVVAVAVVGALVPAAMSTFGTVVPGVGTIHASAAAGGLAANMQVISHALPTVVALSAAAGVAYISMGEDKTRL